MNDTTSNPKHVEGNRYFKELKKYVKINFTEAPKNTHINLYNQREDIIKNKIINIRTIFDDKGYQQFIKKNNTKHIDDVLNQNFTDGIIELFEKIINEELTPSVLINETRSSDYKDVIIKHGEIIPNEVFDIKSLKMNLFLNNNIEFIFNSNIQLKQLDKNVNYIQTLRLEINGSGEQISVPTKYEVICTARVKGIECGNLISFCDIHKNSSVTCCDNPNKTNIGHIIKKLDIAPVKESVIFYSYDGHDTLDELKRDLQIYSLVEITKEIVTCNAIYIVENKTSYLLILNIKEEENEIRTLNYNILLKDDKSRHFLDDIYKSLQKYFLKEHDILITNQNKIIGEIIIFIALNSVFYKKRMHALIIGQSSSGKSFWSKTVLPIFTFNYKVVNGGDVTRNRFLGGRSNIVSPLRNSPYQIGWMGTQDIIFCEESTESLNKLFDPNNKDKESNIFTMLKKGDENTYDVGIQGSKPITSRASSILVGNLEQLNHVSKYRGLVIKKYRTYSGGLRYKNNWPLYKPLESYSIPELAKAHLFVRKNEWIGNYITKLDEAEQVRFDFMIALEDEEENFKKSEMEHNEILKKVHRTEFINELKTIFNKEIPNNFKQKIYDYYEDEFLKARNNIMKDGYKRINNHLKKRQFRIVSQFIFMNKLYYNQEFELTEMDKRLVENFLIYNYNCINSDESALIKKPFINDYLGIIDEEILNEEILNYDIIKKEEYHQKMENEKKEIENMVEKDKQNLLE